MNKEMYVKPAIKVKELSSEGDLLGMSDSETYEQGHSNNTSENKPGAKLNFLDDTESFSSSIWDD